MPPLLHGIIHDIIFPPGPHTSFFPFPPPFPSAENALPEFIIRRASPDFFALPRPVNTERPLFFYCSGFRIPASCDLAASCP